ncbi:Leucine-rich repeat-containing protein 16B [Pteropus alecto]|uniref:Leucine-rich repeat-containing protein 16B n=1 Tax=Pteropus alecto TaxID=9402 RepID=L5KHS1_PTEAL|nr:Leucine-rich repeat-containing protein 16B [Pteropus alecto]
MRVAEGHNKMLSNVAERVTVPRNFIRGALLEQAGQDIQNKLDEVKLSVVTYLTNSIVDEILQELYHSHKSLARHLAQLRTLSDPPGGLGQGQDLTSRSRGHNHDHEETTDDELGTNIDTMAIKKQKRCRKIRPVSAFISESPASILTAVPVPGTRQENGMATRLDEGLEDFFSRRVMDESSSYPRTLRTLRPGLSEPPLPPLQKKRRRGLFHFRRPRSFKGDRGPGSPTTGLLLPPPPPPPPTQESTPSPEPPSHGNNSSPCWSPEEESGLLPGFGGTRGPSFRRKMGTGPDLEGSGQAWQKRRSSDDAGSGAWKPPPPPQSTKPSFSAMRRAEATWHIAEESAPNHSCQSPSPASQDGEEEKEGELFPERTVPTRNAKVTAGKAGPPDSGRRTAPLKPKRTRRAQSCDKLEPDRRWPPDPTGASGVGERAVPLPTQVSIMVHPTLGGRLSLLWK